MESLSKFIQFVVDNGVLIIAAIAVIVVITVKITNFFNKSRAEQVKRVKACLLNWVVYAERELGGGTGEAKLSTVYGMFVQSFPVFKLMLPYSEFKKLVDESLQQMDKLLEENAEYRTIVNPVSDETEV